MGAQRRFQNLKRSCGRVEGGLGKLWARKVGSPTGESETGVQNLKPSCGRGKVGGERWAEKVSGPKGPKEY